MNQFLIAQSVDRAGRKLLEDRLNISFITRNLAQGPAKRLRVRSRQDELEAGNRPEHH